MHHRLCAVFMLLHAASGRNGCGLNCEDNYLISI